MKEIMIKDITVEPTDGDKIEIVYIPEQTQILQAGKEYKFVINLETKKTKK